MSQEKNSTLAKYLPILDWLPRYQRGWLRHDLIAGLTVLTVLVPEGLAYAQMAGLPPEAVFYAAPAALILYALFTTSRHVVVGPSSAIAAMSAAVIGRLAAAGSPEFISLSIALAVVSGLLFLLFGLLRAGFLSEFFAKPVIAGFVFGLALSIALSQTHKLFGLEPSEGDFFERAWHFLTHLGETHLRTLLVGGTSFILLFGLHKVSRLIFEDRKNAARIPAALVTLIYGIVMSTVLDLHGQGVHVVGHFPAGLALPRLPHLSFTDLQALLPGAMIVFILGYVETIGSARSFAGSHERSDANDREKSHENGHELNANRELIALGMANVGAGLMQGFVVDANLSFSADNEEAGARTPLSSLVAAGLTILTALFLTPLFHNLPEATLAAIVVHAMLSLMDVKELKRYYTVRRFDFWVALVALVGVLVLGIVLGFLIAVIISVLALLYRASRPRFSVLGRVPGEDAYGDLERHPEYRPLPGLLIVRPNSYLFFANATTLHEEVRRLIAASDPRPSTVLLDLEASDELDLSSADALLDLAGELEAQGIELHLTRVHAPALELLRRDGVVERIGEAHVHHTVHQGVEAFQQS